MLVAGRELGWGLPATSREIAGWRARAQEIPDEALRKDALGSIACKRDHAEGSAFFWTLPSHRNLDLLRLLVAYQTIWDFLDDVSERDTDAENARQLHLALVEALDPGAPVSDYYRYCRWKDDGGYLRALVETCQVGCSKLPSYPLVRPYVLAGVEMCSIQSLNHDPDPQQRDLKLRAWAQRNAPDDETDVAWHELAAAASGFTPHPLLALAAESSCEESEIVATAAAYFPWLSLAITMLDSYADQLEDALSGRHSYVSHYEGRDTAVRRLCEIVSRSAREIQSLRANSRHTIVLACMVAMYLSRDSANAPNLRRDTRAIAASGGALTRLLLPIVRAWRRTYLDRIAHSSRRASRRARGSATRPVDEAVRRAGRPPGSRLPRAVQTFAIWRSPHGHLERCRRRYGDPFTLNKTSHPPLVFLSSVKDIQAMLTAPAEVLHPGEGANTIMPLVGEESFMLRDEDEHLSGRRMILPHFRLGAVQRRADLIAGIVRREIDTWPTDTPLALHSRLRGMTLQTILRTALDTDGAPTEGDLDALRERLLRMLSITASSVFPEPLLRHGPGRLIWRRFLRRRDEVDDLIYTIIEARMRGRGCSHDLLDRFLRARNADGSRVSQRQMRDNVMSLVLAGHETTASQLTWAFQLLAHNPRVQRRLIEEIDLGVGEDYLTATVQEVLRHRPVFLFAIPRAVVAPIEIGGWTYRPPTHLLGCIYLLHHDPSIYPDPQEFRPERFFEHKPHLYTWMPWGGGRKRCPGSHLAMLEMKTVLRTVLERMTIDPASPRMERPVWRSVIVTPHAGGRVILRARQRPTIASRRLTPGRTPRDTPIIGRQRIVPADRSINAYDTRPCRIGDPSEKPIKSNTDFSQNI